MILESRISKNIEGRIQNWQGPLVEKQAGQEYGRKEEKQDQLRPLVEKQDCQQYKRMEAELARRKKEGNRIGQNPGEDKQNMMVKERIRITQNPQREKLNWLETRVREEGFLRIVQDPEQKTGLVSQRSKNVTRTQMNRNRIAQDSGGGT